MAVENKDEGALGFFIHPSTIISIVITFYVITAIFLLMEQ